MFENKIAKLTPKWAIRKNSIVNANCLLSVGGKEFELNYTFEINDRDEWIVKNISGVVGGIPLSVPQRPQVVKAETRRQIEEVLLK